MKPESAIQEVYNYYDKFLETSVIGSDSYITDNKGIFTIDNLNACVNAFVDNPDTSDRNFDEKSKDQFSKSTNESKEVFAHFIWLWALSASEMRSDGKKSAVTRFLGENYIDKLKNVFVDSGIGSAGTYHKQNKPFEISYLLLLFREIKNKVQANSIKCIDSLKEEIETLCKNLYYKKYDVTSTIDSKLKGIGTVTSHHLIIHLCNPDKNEAIASIGHKKAIINTFFSLLDKENTDELWEDIDDSIFKIRKKLEEVLDRKVSFYDKEIKDVWYFGENKEDFSEVALFEYKKAMIFYGPPGTSKTYLANRLAELLVSKQYFRNKQSINDYFINSSKIFEDHIHRLQLHSNYNYEDFIAGFHIEEKISVVKAGYLLQLIEKIKDDKLPHILILDEINRTDISRLFGELFSALEYRNKKIKLSVGNLEISLPENLYFIGTMNEIDFSLERVDFALRRRFLWQFKGFDKNILLQMLREKRENLKMNISDNDIDIFANRCEKLNNEISAMPELGENYQIGHTFFAEVVDVFKTFKGIHSGRLVFLKQPVNILWEISIKPMLQAILGNLETDSKKEKTKELQNAFIDV